MFVTILACVILLYWAYLEWDQNKRLVKLEIDNLGIDEIRHVEVKSGKLTKSTEDAVGYDLHADEDTVVLPGTSRVIKTGLVTEMYGCFGLIRDRSGLAAKKRLTTRSGVIDPKYPLEWGVLLVNEGLEPQMITKGDRIAQVLFLPDTHVMVIGDEVVSKDTVRTGGFGSTDTNPTGETHGNNSSTPVSATRL